MNNLSRSIILFSGFTAGLIPSVNAAQKNNILFIVVDDLRPELGCYGEKHMITPNIDNIANDGTLFRNAYVQYAVSSASRASFLTGCRPDATGVNYPYSEYFALRFLPEHPSIQKHMYDNGYYTRTLGKIHHGLGEDLSEKNYSSPLKGSYALAENNEIDRSGKKKERPLTEFADLSDEHYVDGQVADEAAQTIRRAVKSGKPFFIAAGFLKPHLPFVAPKKYLDMYSQDQIPPCPFPTPTEEETPYSRSFYNVNEFKDGSNDPATPLSFELSQQLRRAYFACATFTDAQIGKLIKELKEQGVYDNTAIVLIGDHGWHLGDNAMWGKQANFERTTRAPLIVKAPKDKACKVKETTALTEFVDIYPTMCEFAQIPTPEFVEGCSFMSLLYDTSAPWKSAVFSQHPRNVPGEGSVDGYAMRTPEYRYVEWRKEGRIVGQEIYDHRTDPLETKNIASQNPDLCKILSDQLKAGWRAALPKGVVNSSNNPKAPKSPAWGPEASKKKKTIAMESINDLMNESALRTVVLK